MSGNVCKWCGTKWTEKVYHSYMPAYPCGSWHDGAGQWIQGIACRDRCLEMRLAQEETIEILKAREANTVEALRGHIEDLRQRIADAIDKAQRSIRFALEVNSSIQCVLARDMDRVQDILQGNSPEIPDSSNSPANLESST